MNAELEALRQRIYNISNSYFPLDSFFNDICNIEDKDYDKEQAYKDIEKICSLFEKLLKDQERKEKLEKALNIFKYKIVNPYLVKFYKTVEAYNANRTKTCYMYDELTETEFNLLKEIM